MNEKLIYIVDDDELMTTQLAARFQSVGFVVKTFASGEECIAAIDTKPDLIILDFYFFRDGSEAMNGMEVFDVINRQAPDVPVIMLSAQEKGDVVLELARKGIADYLIKDSHLTDNLLIAVKEILKV